MIWSMKSPAYRRVLEARNGNTRPMTETEMNEFDVALEKTRRRMGDFYHPNQVLGRRSPIGCVAVEITQRCNLDCTLCYLSETAESVKDVPIQEVFRRLDNVRKHYGIGADVQLTGGDPTLRDRAELVEIIKYTRKLGLVPTLMTNGILATRKMLTQLVEAGLNEVAFHVDITQERKPQKTEIELNEVREKYIERAKGLGIGIIFNTTICKQNFHEIPELVRFFKDRADLVQMASFQLQADTGRGVLRERDQIISVQTVRESINEGVNCDIAWDTSMIGHPKCNRYGMVLVANGNCYPFNDDQKFFSKVLDEFALWTRNSRRGLKKSWVIKECFKHPIWFGRALKHFLPRFWRMRRDIMAARGEVNRISFFIHNFMGADHLDAERLDTCSFMVMTPNGPVAMCAVNAKRDDYTTTPFDIATTEGTRLWNPLTGEFETEQRSMASCCSA